uniref:3-isopropylmalate dehydratase large subunit n=1 Tax=Azotobacter vinelandii TaxID=354 RepID=LEUC_AZOVI|nr:RecName: Full=3-isopropylmalate dehydratase large subunit; AltName: Full=Alpha-IPM isomerase; Short=IPMI; AltName: Full=Isopropylmalate isomerase [Azotobacter vinelandii]CAA72149.1 LeuC protein [Azotobacter vinelandii]
MAGKTLYDKLWDMHEVKRRDDGSSLIYIDRQILHEVTSPQVRGAAPGRANVARGCQHRHPGPQRADHPGSPVGGRRHRRRNLAHPGADPGRELRRVRHRRVQDERPAPGHRPCGRPGAGRHLPGMTVVCGDSHTSTHWCGALAHGIGTSEVEHVLATQCLVAKKMKNMQVRVEGELPLGVSAKDIVLAVIGRIGTAGGTGHALEFAGSAIRGLSMEGRMTLCNMAIEAGARVGMVAVDEKTIDYVKGRPYAPQGADWDKAVAQWRELVSDADAGFDTVVELKAEEIRPQVTWGTSPEMVLPVDERVPDPASESDPVKRDSIVRALKYMGLAANQPIGEIKVDRVFIGSCTNSRIEDLRAAAEVAKGARSPRASSRRWWCRAPGWSRSRRRRRGWTGSSSRPVSSGATGCSMCLAMNPDRLESGEHCASTSNRNFEGRQGAGGRTHLVSPAMAAAAAVAGRFVDVRQLLQA